MEIILAKNIYLAAPFFDDEQVARVESVEKTLAKNSTVGNVFSPRKHQLEQYEFGTKEWATAIYKNDVEQIDECDLIVAIVDFEGSNVDSGTAFEIGYGVKANIPVIVFHEKDTILNLMISESLTAHLTSIQQLENYDFDKLESIPYDGKMF